MILSPKDEALARESRAHWKRMRDDPEGCRESTGTEGCALCGEYFSVKDGDCTRCPVMRITGEPCCQETPYVGTCTLHARVGLSDPGTLERRAAVLAFQQAADRVIAWIDENLLADADALKCPKCGSKSVSLHLRFNSNIVGCRACLYEWSVESDLADEQQLPSEVTRAAEREGDDE